MNRVRLFLGALLALSTVPLSCTTLPSLADSEASSMAGLEAPITPRRVRYNANQTQQKMQAKNVQNTAQHQHNAYINHTPHMQIRNYGAGRYRKRQGQGFGQGLNHASASGQRQGFGQSSNNTSTGGPSKSMPSQVTQP